MLALYRSGRQADALAAYRALHLARCDDLLASGGDWCGQTGVLALCRGIAASARGRHDEADAAHASALPWKRAETLLSWARCCVAAGWNDQAEEKRRAGLRIYDELNAPLVWRSPYRSCRT